MRDFTNREGKPMQTRRRITALALVIAGAVWAVLPSFGATPQPLPTQQVPKLSLKWLTAMTLSPTTAAAGQNITGTVVLMRNAVEKIDIGLRVDGAQFNEVGVQVIDNVIAPVRVSISPGNDKATFQIDTSKNTRFTGTKSYRITASYGSESVSQTFAVNNGLARKLP
jgi:hypothetical protein